MNCKCCKYCKNGYCKLWKTFVEDEEEGCEDGEEE